MGIQFPAKVQAAVTSDENLIPWTTTRKLVWDDFMSKPLKQGDAVASTSTTLGLSYQVREGRLSFDISCIFSRHKSWGILKTDYILAHEQAHFDITEIHARKLYEALYAYELNPATVKTDISQIYERIVQEKEAMQEAYDSQTDHSRQRRIQYDWFDKINQMLAETELYAGYP